VQVVNLLVTPEQAEILNLATQQTIQLVLRNPTDREIVKTPGASTLNLYAGGRIRAPRIDVDSEDSRPKPQQYISPGESYSPFCGSLLSGSWCFSCSAGLSANRTTK
jgi:hypothetical protein